MPTKIKVAPPDLRTDFADAEAWQEMARARGLRLPLWRMRCSLGQMRKWLKKLGMTSEEYYEWWAGERQGNIRLMDFNKKNPDWPLRAWVGLMLELSEDIKKRSESVPVASAGEPKPTRKQKAVPSA